MRNLWLRIAEGRPSPLPAIAAATVLTMLLIVGELVCGVWFLARPRSEATRMAVARPKPGPYSRR